jgi:hypothetical protein
MFISSKPRRSAANLYAIKGFQVIAHRVIRIIEPVEFDLDYRLFFLVAHGVGDGAKLSRVFEEFLAHCVDPVGEIKFINPAVPANYSSRSRVRAQGEK